MRREGITNGLHTRPSCISKKLSIFKELRRRERETYSVLRENAPSMKSPPCLPPASSEAQGGLHQLKLLDRLKIAPTKLGSLLDLWL